MCGLGLGGFASGVGIVVGTEAVGGAVGGAFGSVAPQVIEHCFAHFGRGKLAYLFEQAAFYVGEFLAECGQFAGGNGIASPILQRVFL